MRTQPSAQSPKAHWWGLVPVLLMGVKEEYVSWVEFARNRSAVPTLQPAASRISSLCFSILSCPARYAPWLPAPVHRILPG